MTRYKPPSYAADMLRVLAGETHAIHWGGADGPPLVFWESPIEPFDALRAWDGRVKIGGFVERLHARQIGDVEFTVAEVVGGAFAADYNGLPTLDEMRRGIYARPADTEPRGSGHSYPLIMFSESNFAALAQDALVSGLAIDAVGRLAADSDGWHEVCGLPLLIESLTLLAHD